MKRFAFIAVILALLVAPAMAQRGSTLISKTDTTKTYFHSLGYKIDFSQRVDLILQAPGTSVAATYVEFAFKADTTNVVRVYTGMQPLRIEDVRLDSVYVKGSATGLTFFLNAIKKN